MPATIAGQSYRIVNAAVLAFTALITALTAAPASAQSGPEGCDPGEIRIRFSHVVVEDGHPKGEAARALADAVNETLDGRACMQVFANSELYTDNEVLDALVAGNVELAAPSLSKFEGYTRVFRIFDLPFLFRDADAVEWFQNSGPGSRMKRALKPTGLKALAFWNNGMKQLSATRPLTAPEDARGLTFRIQNSEVLMAQFAVIGATPTQLPFRDVADALREGRVEGQENTWANILSKEFHRWQDGITESNHGVIAYLVVTSEAFWRGLPDDLRIDLTRLIAKVSAEANRRARALDAQAKEELEDQGVAIRRLSPADRAAWIEAMRPVWSRFEAEIGPDLVTAAISANR